MAVPPMNAPYRAVLLLSTLLWVCTPTWSQSDATQALLDSISFDGIDMNGLQTSLENRADPNYVDEGGQDRSVLGTLAVVVSWSRNVTANEGVKAFRALFDHGARIQDPTDAEILYSPISSGQIDVVKILLDHGSSPTSFPASTGSTMTPIELAATRGHDGIIDLLVSYGAPPLSEYEIRQLRLVGLAELGSATELHAYLESFSVEVNRPDRIGRYALLSLAKDWFPPNTFRKLIVLLDAGADPNVSDLSDDTYLSTPLHELVRSSAVFYDGDFPAYTRESAEEAMRLLIAHGAHVAGRDGWRNTPLHIAASQNNIGAARILIESGAKVMDRNRSDETPLDLAVSAEMIQLLRDHGATQR